MYKRFVLFISTVLVCSLQLSAFAVSSKFSDVPVDFWAYQAIHAAVETSVTSGYQDGTFRPAEQVTNAHFAAFIARAFYGSEISTYLSDPWYASYATVLEKHGIPTNTTLESNFSKYINQPINRYDMATILYNVLRDKNCALPTQQELSTAQQMIGDWKSIPQKYQTAVSACYALGLLNGLADGTFGGSHPMNRAQACVVINRLSNLISASSDRTTLPPPAIIQTSPHDQAIAEPQPDLDDAANHPVSAD